MLISSCSPVLLDLARTGANRLRPEAEIDCKIFGNSREWPHRMGVFQPRIHPIELPLLSSPDSRGSVFVEPQSTRDGKSPALSGGPCATQDSSSRKSQRSFWQVCFRPSGK